jgi:CRISPR-associated protein (TIGR03986 family)
MKTDEKFINPFNFIGLFREKDPATPVLSGEKKYSGCLDISITTKSPLFIPNTSNSDKQTSHKTYDFFSHTQLPYPCALGQYEPVIPGSEIRGVIRSIHAAMNNSCLRTDEDAEFFQRKINKETGLLKFEDNSWFLYRVNTFPCEGWKRASDTSKVGKIQNSISNEEKDNYSPIYFTTEKKLVFNPKTGLKEMKEFALLKENDRQGPVRSGYLVVGQEFSGKQHSRVYEILNGYRQKVDKVLIERLEATIQQYNDSKVNKALAKEQETNKKASWYPEYVLDGSKTALPVHFSVDPNSQQISNLSPAGIGKSSETYNMSNFIQGYEACSDPEKCCETCEVFGFVSSSKNSKSESQGHTGHLRFTDATIAPENKKPQISDYYYDKSITIKPLLTPHTSNVGFYFLSEEYWSFDYPNDLVIRGRKFYFHHPVDEKAFTSSEDPKTQKEEYPFTATIIPVKQGITFNSKVYYEDLTETQLQKVIAAIDLFDDDHWQMIGHGKPLGFGSVKIKVMKNVVRTFTKTERGFKAEYKSIQIVPYDKFNEKDPNIKELKFMTDKDTVKKFSGGKSIQVCYPFGKNRLGKTNGFSWFANNKVMRNKSKPEQQLPTALDIVEGNALIYLYSNKPDEHY